MLPPFHEGLELVEEQMHDKAGSSDARLDLACSYTRAVPLKDAGEEEELEGHAWQKYDQDVFQFHKNTCRGWSRRDATNSERRRFADLYHKTFRLIITPKPIIRDVLLEMKLGEMHRVDAFLKWLIDFGPELVNSTGNQVEATLIALQQAREEKYNVTYCRIFDDAPGRHWEILDDYADDDKTFGPEQRHLQSEGLYNRSNADHITAKAIQFSKSGKLEDPDKSERHRARVKLRELDRRPDQMLAFMRHAQLGKDQDAADSDEDERWK